MVPSFIVPPHASPSLRALATCLISTDLSNPLTRVIFFPYLLVSKEMTMCCSPFAISLKTSFSFGRPKLGSIFIVYFSFNKFSDLLNVKILAIAFLISLFLRNEQIKKMSKQERESKLNELRFETLKSGVAANKSALKNKEIKKAIARILTFNRSENLLKEK